MTAAAGGRRGPARAACGAVLARCNGAGGCGADIFWADGPDGRYVALDAEPTDHGVWILTAPPAPNLRPGRPLAPGEQPPGGAARYTAHADTHRPPARRAKRPEA